MKKESIRLCFALPCLQGKDSVLTIQRLSHGMLNQTEKNENDKLGLDVMIMISEYRQNM